MNARLLGTFDSEDDRYQKTVHGIAEAEETDEGVVTVAEDGETTLHDGFELVGVEAITTVWLRYDGSLVRQQDVQRAFEIKGGDLRVYFDNGKQHTWEGAELVRGDVSDE